MRDEYKFDPKNWSDKERVIAGKLLRATGNVLFKVWFDHRYIVYKSEHEHMTVHDVVFDTKDLYEVEVYINNGMPAVNYYRQVKKYAGYYEGIKLTELDFRPIIIAANQKMFDQDGNQIRLEWKDKDNPYLGVNVIKVLHDEPQKNDCGKNRIAMFHKKVEDMFMAEKPKSWIEKTEDLMREDQKKKFSEYWGNFWKDYFKHINECVLNPGNKPLNYMTEGTLNKVEEETVYTLHNVITPLDQLGKNNSTFQLAITYSYEKSIPVQRDILEIEGIPFLLQIIAEPEIMANRLFIVQVKLNTDKYSDFISRKDLKIGSKVSILTFPGKNLSSFKLEFDEKFKGTISEDPRYPLFKHLYDEHGLILLESELDEIIHIVNQIK